MAEKKIKEETTFPKEDFGFEKMFANLKFPEPKIELTQPFRFDEIDVSMFKKDILP